MEFIIFSSYLVVLQTVKKGVKKENFNFYGKGNDFYVWNRYFLILIYFFDLMGLELEYIQERSCCRSIFDVL